MILIFLITILIVGGLAAWIVGHVNNVWPRIIATATLSINLIIVLLIWLDDLVGIDRMPGIWIYEYNRPWIMSFGINWHFAIDGLSLLLLVLTFFLSLISILVSWSQINYKIGFFHFNFLWLVAGITGVFLSMDLFLFYFFWELMLIPMYFIIGIWGHENRIFASFKFFIFTQAGGLIMFLAILGLYLFHGRQTGIYTFEYEELIRTSLSTSWSNLLMAGFLIAFLVKLPAIPFHSWLPDAHTEAPTAGSIILAGLLLKTGAYGLLRFAIPFFPESAKVYAPYGMMLGVLSILYGAKLAFAQTDMKRLVAYTSVSHMGFVLLGIFALNELAYQGVVMQIIAHGISTGALFILVGAIAERSNSRKMEDFGGLWASAPRMGVTGLLFTMASLGLPGMGNFIAEFLILFGAYKSNFALTGLATLGLIAATIYSLNMFQKVFQGKLRDPFHMSDLNLRESMVVISMALIIIGLGVFPKSVLSTSAPPVQRIIYHSKNFDGANTYDQKQLDYDIRFILDNKEQEDSKNRTSEYK